MNWVVVFWVVYTLVSLWIGIYVGGLFLKQEEEAWLQTPGAPLALGCVVAFTAIGWPFFVVVYGLGYLVGRMQRGN